MTETHRATIRIHEMHVAELGADETQRRRDVPLLDVHVKEIAEQLRPYELILVRLETIPGIKRRLAEVILAEIGPDMSRFPTAEHLASWAGMCPGHDESAWTENRRDDFVYQGE